MPPCFTLLLSEFLSTPPSRVATGFVSAWQWRNTVSIHATLAGGDRRYARWWRRNLMFLSTPPSRVATVDMSAFSTDEMFLSTPPSRVATCNGAPVFPSGICFYPRHPRGWRPATFNIWQGGKSFLSTPPSRVATKIEWNKWNNDIMFLSTPPSRVATCPYEDGCGWFEVSIHATLAGGDLFVKALEEPDTAFLSTPPSRVATPLLLTE